MSRACASVHTDRSICVRLLTTDCGSMSSRSLAVKTCDGIGAALVLAMAGQHRPAPRLRDIADEKPRPAILRPGILRQLLDEIEQRRMRPVAVARQAHDLPGRPVDRKGDRPGEAAMRIEPDC